MLKSPEPGSQILIVTRQLQNIFISGKHSERTVKLEIAMILRMYIPPINAKSQIEDSLDAPLTSLKLVMAVEGSHLYRSFASGQPNLPISVIGYATNEVFNQRQVEIFAQFRDQARTIVESQHKFKHADKQLKLAIIAERLSEVS